MHPAAQEENVVPDDILDSFEHSALKTGGGASGGGGGVSTAMGVIDENRNQPSVSSSSPRPRSVVGSITLHIASSITKMRAFAGGARPWKEFFELREYNLPRVSPSMPHVGTNTSPPPTLNAAVSRSYTNWKLYTANYAIAILLVSLVFLAFNPHSLFVLVIVGFLWSYVFILRDNGRTLAILGMQLSGEQTTVILAIASVMIIFFMSNTGHILLGASQSLSLSLSFSLSLCVCVSRSLPSLCTIHLPPLHTCDLGEGKLTRMMRAQSFGTTEMYTYLSPYGSIDSYAT